MRVDSVRPMKNGGHWHPLGSKPVNVPREDPPVPEIDAAALMAGFRSDTTPVMLARLSASLGVSTYSLTCTGCAWADPHRAWAWPMVNGQGKPVGIRLRADDGRKWSVRGGREGIFVPQKTLPLNVNLEQLIHAIKFLPLRESKKVVWKLLSHLPCKEKSGVLAPKDSFSNSTQEDELSELRSRLSQSWEAGKEIMRTLWESEQSDASPELRRAFERYLAVQGLSFETPQRQHRVAYIVEGPTDLAAALTLGLWGIGRPSCRGSVAHTQITINRLGIKRVILITDNDPQKWNEKLQRWEKSPGIEGAKALARELQIPVASMLLPAKDLRHFLAYGGTRCLLDSLERQLVWRQPT